MFPNLDKCDFTLAGVTVDIFDGHLSVVFDPALATQDVMDAGRHFVPFIVVPKAGEITRISYLVSQVINVSFLVLTLTAYTVHGDVDPHVSHTRV